MLKLKGTESCSKSRKFRALLDSLLGTLDSILLLDPVAYVPVPELDIFDRRDETTGGNREIKGRSAGALAQI